MQLESLAETEAYAERFLNTLKQRQDGATVVGLSGDLGSGKTTFVQAIARALGVTGVVTSPTFVIEKIYKVDDPRFTHLVHIDAYRLESGRELQALGWDALMADNCNLIMLEWPERVAEVVPKDTLKIAFEFVDEHTRDISVRGNA